MKTLLALATGAAFLPALAGGALAGGALARTTPGVRLVTAIRALSPAPGVFRYAVTVRPVGGPARAATLVLGTRRPAVWTAAAPGCLSSRDRTALACDLGDLSESEPRTLRLTGRPGEPDATEVPVIARAAAANAPSVTSALGAVRPAALAPGKSFVRAAGARRPADEPPAAESSAGPDPAPQPSAAESPGVESPAIQAAGAEPSAVPASPDGAAPDAPAGSAPDGSPSVQPSGSGAKPPAVRSRTVRRLGGPARSGGRSRPSGTPGPHRSLGAPAVSAEPERSHVGAHGLPAAPIIPHTPIIRHEPGAPDLPGASELPAVGAPASPPPLAPGGQAVPLPGAPASPALPQIAARPSPEEGISELTTMSPAGAMQAGRTSWATLIAVAVVAEAGLLWLVAGLTVWRRRRAGAAGVRLRTRSPWPRISRLLP